MASSCSRSFVHNGVILELFHSRTSNGVKGTPSNSQGVSFNLGVTNIHDL